MGDAKLVATILIPTHNHGPTLRASVASALRQTVSEIEVLIIGDGVTEETRDIACEIVNSDERVIFFDNPKGERHGETHRHTALQSARGRIVCYLSDDDLYFPSHVEHMCELLEEVDFAHALATKVEPNGALSPWTVDLSLPIYRAELLGERNRVPLSAGAHTLSAYRALAEGWASAPAGIPTDLFMWQKFIRHPQCRFRAGWRPTVLSFPAPDRKAWLLAERAQELETWLERVSDTGSAGKLNEAIYKEVIRASAETEGMVIWDRQSPKCSLRVEMLQVFFPRNGDYPYAEEASAKYFLGAGSWQTIDTVLAYRQPYSIRIDPATGPCLVQIREICVRRKDGRIAWQLSAANLGNLQILGSIAHDYHDATLSIVNEGNDPQVLLPHFESEGPEEEVRLTVTIKYEVWDREVFEVCHLIFAGAAPVIRPG
jgi:GalNAc5-diNAcBac-PP-undecaprenol beta-1,3-glucosyltransferase